MPENNSNIGEMTWASVVLAAEGEAGNCCTLATQWRTTEQTLRNWKNKGQSPTVEWLHEHRKYFTPRAWLNAMAWLTSGTCVSVSLNEPVDESAGESTLTGEALAAVESANALARATYQAESDGAIDAREATNLAALSAANVHQVTKLSLHAQAAVGTRALNGRRRS